MTAALLIVTVLVLLISAAIAALWFDARQRRMNRQLEIAIPVTELANLPSIRRMAVVSRWQPVFRLINYRPEVPYAWHPLYMLLGGVAAAAAIFYANSLFQFP